MAHIDLDMYNPDQAPAAYPFSSFDASVNTDIDADTDAWCGQDLIGLTGKLRLNVTKYRLKFV